MPKSKKKNQNQPKQKKQPKNQPNATGIPVPKTVSKSTRQRPAVVRNHHRAVCSMLDPFCVHARGAQRPDGGPPSIPYQVRELLSVVADGTTGTAKYCYIPGYGIYWGRGAQTVTGNWDYGSVYAALGNTFVANYAREIRIVSFGCVVRNVGSATTAQGSLILSTVANPDIATLQQAKGSLASTESVVINLAPGMEYTWISKPIGPTAHLFKNKANVTTTTTDLDWTTLVVEATGCSTTNAAPLFTVEYVINVEFTVIQQPGSATDQLAQLTKTAPVPNPVATHAYNVAQTQISSFVEGGITKAGNYLAEQAMLYLQEMPFFAVPL